MRLCRSCGEKNKVDVVFCIKCGQNFKGESEISTTSDSVKTDVVQGNPSIARKKMNKKQKILLSFLGTVLLLGVISHVVLSNLYNPVKKIQAMNNAYNTQDKEALFNEFHVKKGTVADAQNFYATINEYGWTELRDNLTYEVEKIKNNEHTNIIYNTGEFISVNKKPILFGIYNNIEFTIIPTEVSVYAPMKNMTIRFGDKEVFSQEDDEQISLGHFIAGNYEWSYEYDDGLMPLSGKSDYYLGSYEDNAAVIDVDWNFTTLTIESDIEDAILVVDGKSTGKTVSELYEFYPAQLRPSSKIYAQIEDKDGKEVKSDILPLDSEYLYLRFEHVQQEIRIAEHEEVIRDLYKNFRSNYEDAIYYTNFSYIENYFKDGSQIKQNYAKFITDHEKIPGYYYDFLLNDITAFKALSDTKFELQSFETFNYSSEEDGNIHYERKKKYTISYADEDYFIDEILDVDTKKTNY